MFRSHAWARDKGHCDNSYRVSRPPRKRTMFKTKSWTILQLIVPLVSGHSQGQGYGTGGCGTEGNILVVVKQSDYMTFNNTISVILYRN